METQTKVINKLELKNLKKACIIPKKTFTFMKWIELRYLFPVAKMQQQRYVGVAPTDERRLKPSFFSEEGSKDSHPRVRQVPTPSALRKASLRNIG